MGATIFEAPPHDPAKSQIENVLELTPVTDIGPDVFTNTRPLWHPPGARGIYGGAAIAQCLSAAQKTVPADFFPHSMHCYFVLSGDSRLPVLYHVERVRDGRSFATRTVQARQQGRPIFTTTLSFDREGSGGKKQIKHTIKKPDVAVPESHDGIGRGRGPFESRQVGITNRDSPHAADRTLQLFNKARGTISSEGGRQAHLTALAYMSDSYFIGTVAKVHNIPRFSSPGAIDKAAALIKKDAGVEEEVVKKYLTDLAEQEERELKLSKKTSDEPNREIGMMVSLDHTIYFHDRREFRADEWIFSEMKTPWAGAGRGLVLQQMWAQDGTLIATCVQEGVVRLKQDKPPSSSKL
ncbi:acyl-CoA thioesterase II [Arthroderma uncinatum]|uniref:acyl-CoA thioesterase II n=1 Tax=Arthroderma uncinatum TaxID=74035 RepID=UPI00144AECBE|nr:acyl-CoA thioesterase II [Arthroderma uncinatum]KAF3481245.1 acyl-CoA thioesterase II [Arthroderma uncinatum]